MPEFTIHSVPGSPYGRAVLVALEEKKAAYRVRPVAAGGLKTEPHISLHPFGKIPAIEHGDFRLYETQAILRYIDRIIPTPALTPTDAHVAARMDQVMAITDWYLFQGVANIIVFQRIVLPRLLGGSADEALVASAMPQAATVIEEIARLLGDNRYMTGEDFTLADVHLAPQLSILSETPEGESLMASYPKLRAWIARVEARPSFVATTWEQVEILAQAA